jgi:hypothetical protein
MEKIKLEKEKENFFDSLNNLIKSLEENKPMINLLKYFKFIKKQSLLLEFIIPQRSDADTTKVYR